MVSQTARCLLLNCWSQRLTLTWIVPPYCTVTPNIFRYSISFCSFSLSAAFFNFFSISSSKTESPTWNFFCSVQYCFCAAYRLIGQIRNRQSENIEVYTAFCTFIISIWKWGTTLISTTSITERAALAVFQYGSAEWMVKRALRTVYLQ